MERLHALRVMLEKRTSPPTVTRTAALAADTILLRYTHPITVQSAKILEVLSAAIAHASWRNAPLQTRRSVDRFGERIMPLPLAPILIAGATTAIGWVFQENSARLKRQRQQREDELARAQAIYKETSEAMDTLYYLLDSAAIHVAVRNAKDDSKREREDIATWSKLEAAVMHWMTHKTRFASQVRQYFGDECFERLDRIHRSFVDAWDIVENTYYDGKRSIAKDGKASYRGYRKYFGIVRSVQQDGLGLKQEITALSERMMRDLQHQNVGILRKA